MTTKKVTKKAGKKTSTTLTEHIVEIISDSGEGAQRCGQSLGSIAARMGNGDFVNNAKIGVKTVVVIAIVVIALVFKKKQNVSAGVFGAIGGLALLNLVIAVMWH